MSWRTVAHRGVLRRDRGTEGTDLRVRDTEGAWNMRDIEEVSRLLVRSWQSTNPITVRWFHMSNLAAMSEATEATEAMEATAMENRTVAIMAGTGMGKLEDAGEYGRTTLDEHDIGRQIQLIYRPSEGLPLASKPRIFDRFTVVSQFQQVPVPVNRGLTSAEYPRVRQNLVIPAF